MAALKKGYTDKDLVDYVMSCYREAENARRERERFNECNYDAYHMRHDFTHKVEGQSVETFAKPRMAVEQTKSFFQQSLADLNDQWFSIERKDTSIPDAALPVKPHELKKILAEYLHRAKYYKHIGLCVQRGLNEAVMTSKVYGKMVPQPRFVTKKDKKGKRVVKEEHKTWELCFERVRARDWYPDPTGNGLYCIEEMNMDMHVLKRMAEYDDTFMKEAVNGLTPSRAGDSDSDYEKRRETGQSDSMEQAHRPQVKVVEYWGDIVSADGEVLEENVVVTVANDTTLIRKPTPNPLWHQDRPYTSTPLMEVDGSVWHVALMDAPVQHNKTYTELFNLVLDAAFKQVHAASQIRVQDLHNQEQIANGIKPGEKLLVKSSLPPGAKVMEPLEDVIIPNDALSMLNMLQQEFNQAALTNDLRQGVLPSRSVKATEVVEASQTITSVFQGMTKNIETDHIVRELSLALLTIAQNWEKISKEFFISLFGEERGSELYGMDPQDIFVAVANGGLKFNVYGITQTLAKAQDFQKITTALQTIGGVQLLAEPFMAEFDPKKILMEMMKALNIDVNKIQLDEKQREMNSQGPEMAGPGMASPAGAPPAPGPMPGPLASIFGAGEASNGFQGGM